MPTYTFQCDACGHIYEVFLWYSQQHPTDCPSCEASAIRQIFGCGVVGSYPVTTFGQQAEENARREGRECLQNMIADKKANGPNAGQDPGEIPWYRSGEIEGTTKLEKPLDLTKVKDVQSYICEGKVN